MLYQEGIRKIQEEFDITKIVKELRLVKLISQVKFSQS